ncbi:MAG TPA: VWA domain-containing protein [Opitutaceae bacterium]
MNDTRKLSPDDPQLTAYALGELDGAERAAVEAAVRADPALQAAVAELRAFACDLGDALAHESAPTPTDADATDRMTADPISCRTLYDKMAEPVQNARAGGAPSRGEPRVGAAAADPYRRKRKVVRFPFYYVVTGLAAAGFAVVVWIHDRDDAAKEQAKVQVFEVNLERARSEPAEATSADQSALGGKAVVEVTLPEASAPSAPAVAPVPPVATAVVSNEAPAASAASRAAPLLEQVKRENAVSAASSPQVAFTPPADPSIVGRRDAAATGAVGVESQVGASWSTDHRLAEVKHPLPASGQKSELMLAGATGTLPASRNPMLTHYTVAGEGAVPGYVMAPGNGASPAGNVVFGDTTAASSRLVPEPTPAPPSHLAPNTEGYAYVQDNAFLGATENPLSTFSIDVDTASYANVRRFLRGGRLPPRDAVRIEELVNYFPYGYEPPTTNTSGAAAEPADSAPFAAHLEVASAPWAPEHRLVRIGLKGRELATAARPAANLVFLLDVSGSMSASNKLPLVKESMRLLLGKLRPDDRVAIVTYAGASGLALPSTPVKQKADILASLDLLRPGGSTNGAMGIQLAYDVAKANFVGGGLNRVILCTDGDFNVGVTSQGELVRLIEDKAKSGVFLTVLGFGMGNYKDATLEQLADKGNGAYGYIDTEREARKLLVEQVEGTLATIAQDVKVQVEFNPARVAAYRLIGYENRLLKKEDFNNDTVDAGEVGAGHTVTALYEVVPAGVAWSPAGGTVDELKYRAVKTPHSAVRTPHSEELLTVKVRYKAPGGDTSRKLEFPLTDRGTEFAAATADFKFSAAVAGFGLILRESPHKGAATFAKVIDWAEDGLAEDPDGHRTEFIELVRTAQRLAGG